jgi:hypothetical protein
MKNLRLKMIDLLDDLKNMRAEIITGTMVNIIILVGNSSPDYNLRGIYV